MDVDFIENIETNVKDWAPVKNWIMDCVVNEGKSVGVLSFVFMSDEELLTFNRKYLNHDYHTDVITFDNSEFPVISGDVLISVEMVLYNCNILKISYKEEFLRIIIHGVLHLCGYKDKAELDILEMRRKEEFYLGKVTFEI